MTPPVLLALLSALLLAALHLAAPRIRKLPLVPEHVTASFAGGIAVAYVFLHLLPELSVGSTRLREVLGDDSERSPLMGLEIFTVALVGFVVFYGLERLAQGTRARQPVSAGAPGGGGDGRDAPNDAVFAVHLGSYCVYNAIIAYTLPLNWRTSVPFAVLFTIAMGLHFVLSDRGLEEHYGDRFDRRGPRLLLAGAVLAGWAVATVFVPTSTLVVSVLVAFLAGSVLLNVFKEELPSTRRSHFGWFVAGLVLYGLLLGAATVLAETA